MLTVNFLGKTQVYLSMFGLCWACSVLVSCTHTHLLPYCCPNRELREHMAAMIFRGFFRLCEQGRVSVCAYRVYAWPSTSRSNTYMFGLCQWPKGIYRPNRSCHLSIAFAKAALLMTFYCTLTLICTKSLNDRYSRAPVGTGQGQYIWDLSL